MLPSSAADPSSPGDCGRDGHRQMEPDNAAQDGSSTGCAQTRHHRHRAPHSLSSWKPRTHAENSLHSLFLPLHIKSPTICSPEFIPSIRNHPEGPRTFVLWIFTVTTQRSPVEGKHKTGQETLPPLLLLTTTLPSTAPPKPFRKPGRSRTREHFHPSCPGFGSRSLRAPSHFLRHLQSQPLLEKKEVPC